jgi:hypothetical protein
MIFRDLTKDVVYESLQRYLQMNDNRTNADMKTAGELYDNTVVPVLPDTMQQDLKDEYSQTFTPIPIGRLIVQKISNAMYGRSIQRTTGSEDLDKEWAQIFSRISVQAPIACRACSTYGDAAIRIVRNYRGLILTLFTGKQIHPLYDPEAPDDQPVGMIYTYQMQTVDDQIRAKLQGQHKAVLVEEIITRHQRDIDGKIVIPGIRAKFVEGQRIWYSDDDPGLNPYGDFLDCSYWRNSMEIHSHRGESDIIPLQKLLEQINNTVTDSKIFLKWNQWPLLYTSAMDDKTNPMKYHWRAFNFLGETSDGSPATMGKIDMNAEQIGGYIEFLNYLMQMVSMTSRVCAVSIGDTTNVGQLASGIALQVAMIPLTDMIDERTPLFVSQELDLMRTIMAVQAVHNSDTAILTAEIPGEGVNWLTPSWETVTEILAGADVEFGAMAIAKSALEEAQVHSIRIAAGYESERTAIEATNPTWTETDVLAELDRIGAGSAQQLDTSAQSRVEAMRQAMAPATEEKKEPTDADAKT